MIIVAAAFAFASCGNAQKNAAAADAAEAGEVVATEVVEEAAECCKEGECCKESECCKEGEQCTEECAEKCTEKAAEKAE